MLFSSESVGPEVWCWRRTQMKPALTNMLPQQNSSVTSLPSEWYYKVESLNSLVLLLYTTTTKGKKFSILVVPITACGIF